MSAPEGSSGSLGLPKSYSASLGSTSPPSNSHISCNPPDVLIIQHQTSLAPTSRSFLDLPLELRRQIYGYFKHIPLADSQDEQNRNDILISRRVLQLVCPQINQEWSEFFFSTTTVIANDPSPKPDDSSGKSRIQFTSLASFEIRFLKKVDPWKLQQLRRIHYNISSHIPYRTGRLRAFLSRSRLNVDAAINLAAILSRHHDTLATLEEVSFLATIEDGWRSLHEPTTTQSWERIWRLASDRQLGKKWIKLQNRIQPELQDGSMKNWQVIRRMKIEKKNLFFSSSTARQMLKVNEVELVYRKMAKPILPATDCCIELG